MIRFLRPGELTPTTTPLRYLNSRGYISLRWKVGTRSYVECYEHRVFDGRVTEAEHVHHINHDRTDNRPENLQPMTAAEHREEHVSEYASDCVTLYADGLTTTEVGKRLGINPATVYRLLVSRGVQLRDRNVYRRIPIDDSELRRLHATGLSTLQIAKAMGIERTLIRNRMKNLGLPANGRTYA